MKIDQEKSNVPDARIWDLTLENKRTFNRLHLGIRDLVKRNILRQMISSIFTQPHPFGQIV